MSYSRKSAITRITQHEAVILWHALHALALLDSDFSLDDIIRLQRKLVTIYKRIKY